MRITHSYMRMFGACTSSIQAEWAGTENSVFSVCWFMVYGASKFIMFVSIFAPCSVGKQIELPGPKYYPNISPKVLHFLSLFGLFAGKKLVMFSSLVNTVI